jgi:hypothetical protein
MKTCLNCNETIWSDQEWIVCDCGRVFYNMLQESND